MNRWIDLGDGEYRCTLPDGSEVQVFDRLLWYVAVDDRMVDDIFFCPADAMQAVDAWSNGDRELTFHPTDRPWQHEGSSVYGRKSRHGRLTVKREACGSWKINQVAGRCFHDAKTAQRFADERIL